jgi:hypothetical protein
MINQNRPSITTSFTAEIDFLEKVDIARGKTPRSVFIRKCVNEHIDRESKK